MNTQNYVVQANTQLTVGDLRIGVANIRPAESSSPTGADDLSAGIWLSLQNEPEEDRQIRVTKGQKVTIGNYEIEILDVLEATGKGEISLKVLVNNP